MDLRRRLLGTPGASLFLIPVILAKLAAFRYRRQKTWLGGAFRHGRSGGSGAVFVSPDVTLFRRSFRTLFPAGFGRVLTRRIGNGHFLTRTGFPGFRNGLRPAIRPGLGGRNLFLSSRRILFRHGRGDGGSLRSDILHDAGRTNNTRADAFSGTGLFGLCRACALSALSCLVFRRRIRCV